MLKKQIILFIIFLSLPIVFAMANEGDFLFDCANNLADYTESYIGNNKNDIDAVEYEAYSICQRAIDCYKHNTKKKIGKHDTFYKLSVDSHFQACLDPILYDYVDW